MTDPNSIIRSILSNGIPDEFLDKMMVEEAVEGYFRRAFVIADSVRAAASYKGRFDYEVLEKVGDKVLSAVFQLYLYDLMGDTVTTPQPYADMTKVFLATEKLAYLADSLRFERLTNFSNPAKSLEKTKEDIFESFVGAIALAGDRFVAPDFGLVIAKRWLYTVFNSFFRDQIDPSDPSKYVDSRTKISEIWQINNWGPVEWGDKTPDKNFGVNKSVYEVKGPNIQSFPEQFRGTILGYGEGSNVEEAKENAATAALTLLNANYREFKYGDVDYERKNISNLMAKFDDKSELKQKLQALLNDPSKQIVKFVTRQSSIKEIHYVQVRVHIQGMHIQPVATAYSNISHDHAFTKAFEKAAEKLAKNK